MKLTLFFALVVLICLQKDGEGSFRTIHWKDLMKRWFSIKLRTHSNGGVGDAISFMFSLSKKIFDICFDESSLHSVRLRTGRALCDSINIKDTDFKLTGHFTGTFFVPVRMCTNITVVKLPKIDTRMGESFEVGFTFARDNSNVFKITKDYYPFNIITYDAETEISLQQKPKFSRLFVFYQAVECYVSENKKILPPPILYTRDIPRTPSKIYITADLFEFHALIRLQIGTVVTVEATCDVLKQIQFYDGPESWATPVEVECSETSGGSYRVKASTFQMFMVSVVYYSEENPMRDIKFWASEVCCKNFILQYGMWFEWNFNNHTSLGYEMVVIQARYHLDVEYVVQLDQAVGHQGNLCQYGGLYIATRRWYDKHKTEIGPVCSSEYAVLLKDMTFHTRLMSNSHLMLVAYHYHGDIFAQRGKIFVSPMTTSIKSCITIINPCYLCTQDYHLSYINKLGHNFDISCDGSDVFVTLHEGCFRSYVIPDETVNTKKHKTCQLIVYSAQQDALEFGTTHRYIQTGKAVTCSWMMPYMSFETSENYGLHVFERTNTTQSLFNSFHMSLCPNSSILMVEARNIRQSTCKEVVINDTLQMHDPNRDQQRFEGICHKFNLELSKNFAQYQFNISLSKDIEPLREYMNSFILIASSSKRQHGNENFLKYLKLEVAHKLGDHLSQLPGFNFTGQQLPLIWKSYAPFIEISVQYIGKNWEKIPQPQYLKIIAIAINEPSLMFNYLLDTSYIIPPSSNCPKNATHVWSQGCYSFHNNDVVDMSDTWDAAETFCKNRGGYLWSVGDAAEWEEILTSIRCIKVSNKCSYRKVSAAEKFQTSHVMFLGLNLHGEVSSSFYIVIHVLYLLVI